MRHEPILLIHGFNGQPANWTDELDRFPDFLAAEGFDPELIRLFSYGFVESEGKPLYNATGDMRAIAHRLGEESSADPETRQGTIEQLSRDSVARGGPPDITIIAHSSGGLIARHFISCQSEDELHTRYNVKIARLIMLGTPHLGVQIQESLEPLPTPLVFALLARMHPAFPKADLDDIQEMHDTIHDLHQSTLHAAPHHLAVPNTTAYEQIRPDSEFLRELNRPGAMPTEIAYFNIAGDIRVHATVELVDHPLLVQEKNLGDLLVTVSSACTIPNAASESHRIVQQHEVDVTLGGEGIIKAHVNLKGDELPPLHRNLRRHPKVREKILDILNSKT